MASKDFLTAERKIWIIEDDPSLQFIYENALALRYQLCFFSDLQTFQRALSELRENCDLLIADLRLPDGSFLEILGNDNNTELGQIPILIISSFDDLDVFRYCFRQGIVDFLLKPFTKNQLLIKVENVFRAPEDPSTTLPPEDMPLVDSQMLRINVPKGRHIELTVREMQILSHLMSSPHRISTRDEISAKIWPSTTVSPKTLDVHISHLRQKLVPLDIELNFLSPASFSLSGKIKSK